jgi:signal transduction histidine kinase
MEISNLFGKEGDWKYRFIQYLDEGVITTDAHGKVIFANDVALSYIGKSLKEIKNGLVNDLLTLIGKTDQKPVKLLFENFQKKDEIKMTDLILMKNESEKISVEIKIIPKKIKGNNPKSFLIIIKTIDLPKELRQRIDKLKKETKKSKKELQKFAYVISHDLQEPLRMVKSYTQLLERRYKDKLDQSAKDFIDFAVDGADRMGKFIQDLLKFSRVETRGRPFELTDTRKIVERLEDYFSQQIQENNVSFRYNALPTLKADKEQLYEVFKHLIHNALKFRSKNPPEIEISANKKDDRYIFSIKDNGIGIKEKNFERIFIIFQRLHTRSEYAGTGVGLALCKRIIERHGGEIWINSTVGEGSTFYFSIPIREN